MESKKKSAPFVNIGSSSLLVIFMVLCLVTFATLSLSSAQSDYKFSERLADRRTAYYTASNQAEEILGSVDAVLARTYGDSRSTYFSTAQERLSELTLKTQSEDGTSSSENNAAKSQNNPAGEITLELDFHTEIPSISYTVPVNEKQALSVILDVMPADQTADGFYCIQQWKVVSTQEWNGDDTLKLIQ